MIQFKSFLAEAVSDESKLTHLEHAEDHVINAGDKGFAHAFHNLNDVHDRLKGKHTDTSVTTKYDGSPSIIWGHHPKTGKFFVGTKSVFNKDPKINHTPEDIDRNHGHAPGLAAKLKEGLKHLPKVTPKGKIYQGDFMYSRHEVSDDGKKFHFKPNTITYSTHKSSDEGKKISKAKIGIVPHTEYRGNDLENMKAHYNADVSQMKEHPDVHVISAHHDFGKTKYTPDQEKEFHGHMNAATKAFHEAHKDFHAAVEPHTVHLKTYINRTVREGTQPSIKGYKDHLRDHFTKEAGKVKTQKSIDQKMSQMKEHHAHVDNNTAHFQSALNMHKHLAAAKNVLVHALASHQTYEHSIGGVKTKPEGFVAVRNNRPTKLVDRAEFSRANFLARER